MAANASQASTSDTKSDDGDVESNNKTSPVGVKLEEKKQDSDDVQPPKKKQRVYKWTQQMPEIRIEEGGIGPIETPSKNDVLNGRGGRTNAWSGNIQFRELINDNKVIYHSTETKKMAKAHICARIVQQLRSMDPPGRFLKEEEKTGLWWDIGDANAIKKVGQALREHKQEMKVKQAGAEGELVSPPRSKARGSTAQLDPYVSEAVGKALRIHQNRKEAGAAKVTPYPAAGTPLFAGRSHAPPAPPPGEGFRGARYKLTFGTVYERPGIADENRFEMRYDDGTIEMINEAQAKKARGLNENHEQKVGFLDKKVAKLVDGRPLCGTVASFGEKTSGETFWVIEYDDGSVERCNRSALEKRVKFETELKKFCNQFE